MAKLPRPPRERNLITAIDIGGSKVACVIAEPGKSSNGNAEGTSLLFRGVGHHRARGIKSGVVVDIDEAEKSVRGAVAQAERKAARETMRQHSPAKRPQG